MSLEKNKHFFDKTAASLYRDDPILKLLFDNLFEWKTGKLKLGAGRSCIILFIIPIIISILIGRYEDTLYNRPDPEPLLGVLQDYTLYTLWAVVLFSIYLYYKFSKYSVGFLSNDIYKIIDSRKVQEGMDPEKTDQLLSRLLSPAGIYRALYYVFILLFILFWVLNLLKGFDPIKYYGKDIWHSWNHPFGFIFLKFFNLIYTTLLLAIFFFRFTMSLLVFSILFKRISKSHGFIIKPLSPDNSAGLKILSNLSLKFMYMVLPFFLIFISLILRGTALLPGQQIGFLALIILLFVTFFLPLGSVHTAMKKAKEKELENIAGVFSELNAQVKRKMANKEFGKNFNEEIESLEKIDFLYDKTERMPVWPFNLANLGRVAMAALIPLIAFIIDLVSNMGNILETLQKFQVFK